VSAGDHELLLRVQTNKQVECCFLSHNSSIHFFCTDSLLIAHRGGLSIIIWRIGGGGGQASFCPGGPKFILASLVSGLNLNILTFSFIRKKTFWYNFNNSSILRSFC
jgi:hypothetical protein